MKNLNFDFSAFFGSNSNDGFGSFNLKDYASIKNGSYMKLAKSYYSEKKESSSDKKTTDKVKDKTKKETLADTTGLSKMKKEADSMKSAADSLNKDDLWKQTGGKYDMDKIASAVKSFVSGYNDVLSQSEKVTSKDIDQEINYMNSMTHTMSKVLSKVGISVGVGGKLSVNEDTLNKASVSSIKSLFSGSGSYGQQMANYANSISKDAVNSSSMYSSSGTTSSALSNMFNQWI